MAKRGREETETKPGALDELCPNIKRLAIESLGSEALNSIPSSELHTANAGEEHINNLQALQQHIEPLQGQQRQQYSLEQQQQKQLEHQMTQYQDANKLLKQLYLERLARNESLGTQQHQGS